MKDKKKGQVGTHPTNPALMAAGRECQVSAPDIHTHLAIDASTSRCANGEAAITRAAWYAFDAARSVNRRQKAAKNCKRWRATIPLSGSLLGQCA